MSNQSAQIEIERFVDRVFTGLSANEVCIYFRALPRLENRGNGLCNPVIAPLHEWAEFSNQTVKAVTANIKSLNAKRLLSYEPGSNGQDGNGRSCGTVKRYTIDEVKSMADPGLINKYDPEEIVNLKSRLDAHGQYFKSEVIQSTWNMDRTGRLSATGVMKKKKNVKKEARKAILRETAELCDEYVLEVDYISAEPSLLQSVLNRRGLFDGYIDVYQELGNALGKIRKKAKAPHMAIVYGFTDIPSEIDRGSQLYNYFTAALQYRDMLHGSIKGLSGDSRYIETLTGRKIYARKRERIHKGQLLSWHLQGTIADLVTPLLSQVLDDEDAGKCRFLFQAHDSISVGVKHGQTYPLLQMMINAADDANINIDASETVV